MAKDPAMSTLADDLLARWFERVFSEPLSRTDVIKRAWREAGHEFDFRIGQYLVADDRGEHDPILFEKVRYGNVVAVEAEGVIVHRVPVIQM